ncbi:MAG TPA: protein kinase [Vicinamibacterales bacterium]|nr:protein kinase [Vicinamibacterales bacterium]
MTSKDLMEGNRRRQISQLYHAALLRTLPERAAFVREACGGDPALLREVESLLALDSSAQNLLHTPAAVAAAGIVTDGPGISLIARQLGAYRIDSLLGAGGMGEVYRARDTRLGREVAIKILPRAFTADADRLARFEREARVLASLNHPHVAAIYGVEDAPTEAGSPVRALVLELVEGETLAERIARAGSKGLPIKEALDTARQIADALDAAHEKGIVHRDLKPANIKITPQGVVKVLDFGLAKLDVGSGEADDVTAAPTITVNDTREGLIVGTAAYMSPEQARGQNVDKRTDIWAFGCVLYEILTGRAAFRGETISDTIAVILGREPDWTALPGSVPPTVSRLLRRCLEKDPKRRLHDIADARIEIDDALPGSIASQSNHNADVRRRWLLGLVGGSLALALGLAWTITQLPRSPAQDPVLRLTVTPPAGTEFADDSGIALSPDGRMLAFVARSASGSRLWVRPLNSSTSRELRGTDDAVFPFWSPDSRSLGFFAAGQLKRVDLTGGSPTVICDVGSGRGGAWSEQGVIVFNSVNDGPLLRVSASGGTPEPFTVFDSSQGEVSHRWPQFLPGGRRFLYFVRRPQGQSGVYMGTVDRPQDKIRLLVSATNALYVPDADNESGHLFWVRNGALMTQGFEPAKGQLTGEASSVADDVAFGNATQLAAASVSTNGTIVYRATETRDYQLTWYSRDGTSLGVVGRPEPDVGPRISPDGQRVAVRRRGDIWQMEFARAILARVTFECGTISDPIWSPDSQRIGFAGGCRNGKPNPTPTLYSKIATGAGSDEQLLDSRDTLETQDWSPDGKFLLYLVRSNDLSLRTVDLWLLPLSGDRKPIPFLTTPFREGRGQFSPDGKWIAYTSDESGRNEVYVQSFPPSGSKWRISSNGGDWARWRKDGKELFYVAPDRKLQSVSVQTVAGSPQFETPRALFVLPITLTLAGGQMLPYSYDVMPDGQRFLALAPATTESPPLTVIVNWEAELSANKK